MEERKTRLETLEARLVIPEFRQVAGTLLDPLVIPEFRQVAGTLLDPLNRVDGENYA